MFTITPARVCLLWSSGRVWCVVPVAMVSVQHCNGLTTISRPVQTSASVTTTMTTETISEAASLYVRVRPLARTGGHAKRGDKSKRPELKRVAGWGEEGVVVEDRAGARTTFDYMDTVLVTVQ